MKLVDLYTEHIANRLSAGSLILKDAISSLEIRALYDRILTKKNIIKVWAVEKFPVDYDENFTQMIRTEMFFRCPDVKTMVQIVSVPVNTNVSSETFKRKLHSANSQYQEYRELFDSLEEADKITGKSIRVGARKFAIRKEDLEKLKGVSDSYNYVYAHSLSGGQFFKSHVFIVGYFKDKKQIDLYKRELSSLLEDRDIFYKEVRGNMSSYLSNFGPSSYMREGSKRYTSSLLSDENLSYLSPYRTRGLVGGTGNLLGVDWLSKMPFLVDFFKSPTAQVGLLVAKSGSGKTMAAYMICLSLVSKDVHSSVIDIKGGEWEKLSAYVKTLVISMDDKNPRFVNTLRIDDMNASLEDSDQVYRNAVTGTVQLLSLMVNLSESEGNKADLEMILESAVVKSYDKREVYRNNPDTFYRTEGMFYDEVLEVIETLKTSASYTEEQKMLCSLIITRTSPYFKSEGRYSSAFKNEITLSEVLETPLVIYSFNKNNNTMLDSLDNIRVFMSHYLDTKKQYMRKTKGLHTAAFYEELQRSDQFGDLLTFISHSVTGSRSNNVIIFLLLNSLSIFDKEVASPIISNITTVIAGKLRDADMEVLSEQLGCEDIFPYVKRISTGEDRDLNHSFAIRYDNGFEVDKTVFKVKLPKYMEQELRSRDVVETS